MNEYECGSLVLSLTGHDKDNFYVIIKSDDEYVYLVNGKNRTLSKPKKKKKKHIRTTKYKDDYLLIKEEKHMLMDSDIRKAVKQLAALYKYEASY